MSMKKCLCMSGLAVVCSCVFAVPCITLEQWDIPVSFDNLDVVLLSAGDSPDRAFPEYDDSNWNLISLPLNSADFNHFEKIEKSVYWYRIRVKVPEGYPASSIGVNLGKIADVDEAWWNGMPIGRTGDIEDLSSHASNRLRQYEIPASALAPGKINILAIRVRNTWRADELPGRGRYYIGEYDSIRTAFFKSGLRELVFPVVYLVFFAYFMLLFSKRTGQRENLLYSLFSFGFAVYSICRTDIKYEFADNFEVLQKLEFGSMYVCIPLLMAFVLVYFGEKHRLYHYGYYIFSAVCLTTILLFRNHLHWYYFNVYFVQYTWVLPFYELFRTLIRNYKKSVDSRIMLATFAVVCAGVVHDVFISRGLQLFPLVDFWITPFAMFVYVGGIATILSVRFANSMNQIEELNATLELKVEERTAQLDKSLQEIRIRDEKIQQELVMAGNVQQSLLPERLPDWPVRTAVRYQPLREVSGDFYHFGRTGDGGCLMFIGDVSGHGMPAALYAILAIKAFKEAVHRENSPSAILANVNEELCRLDTTHYLTSFVVKYDCTGHLIIANAGHPRAILLSRRNKKITMLDASGTVIGIRDDARALLRDESVPFEKGDRVLLYTDCLTERTNVAGEQFGEERLVESLKKHFFENLDDLIDNTLADFFEFVQDAENKDDLTVVAMEVE